MKLKMMLLVLCLIPLVGLRPATAQDAVRLQCGDIIEGETSIEHSVPFRSDDSRYADEYLLDIQAGTRINFTVTPLGMTFNAGIIVLDSGGTALTIINEATDGQPEILSDFQLGSSSQLIRITGLKPGYVYADAEASDLLYYNQYDGNAGKYFGAYEITVGCTLRDGTVIEPGDTPSDGGNGGGGPNIEPFSGFGFPGLHPVDFATAFRLPLAADAANQGEIPTAGDAILGFYFDANAGDVLALSFERTTGNLNLGLVVLSADNQVAFMSALVSSTTLTTQFTLPSTGEYTIGIFRLDLIPPSAPEPTRFTVQAILNP